MYAISEVQNASDCGFVAFKFEFWGPIVSVPKNNWTAGVIAARSEKSFTFKINHGQGADAGFMSFESCDFISSRWIINDEASIFSSNTDLIFLNFNTTQNNVSELNSFKISLIRKSHIFAPLNMSGLFGVANNTDFSGSGSSMTGGYLAAMDFSDNGLFFINAI